MTNKIEEWKENISYQVQELLNENELKWKFQVDEIDAYSKAEPLPEYDRRVVQAKTYFPMDEAVTYGFHIIFTENDDALIRYDCSFYFYPTKTFVVGMLLQDLLWYGFRGVYPAKRKTLEDGPE